VLVGLFLAAVLALTAVLNGVFLDRLTGSASLIGLAVVVLVALGSFFFVRMERDPAARRRHLLRAGVLVAAAIFLWLLVVDVFLFTQRAGPGIAILSAALCLPTTAFALWVVRRLDRNEKEPWRLVLVAAAWGAVVSTSLVVWGETAWETVSLRALVPGPGLEASIAYAAGVNEELAKGVAVLLLYLVMRDEFDDVVDGIVYGAAVGLGFNFMESISYMTHIYAIYSAEPGGSAAAALGVQWYARQVLGLFFGHATYTALVGAGLGVARQVAGRRRKLLAIASGWLAAIAAHFAWDAWLTFFPISRNAFALIEIHLRTLLMSGPFTAALLVLLAAGLQIEGAGLARQLQAEAEAGTGAVLSVEVPVLVSPWRRLRARLAAFRSGGVRAYLWLARLQTAQLDLAMERWHAERRETDEPAETVEEMRRRALALRSA
jgi:protease PrsW